jgi:hypothetical protein
MAPSFRAFIPVPSIHGTNSGKPQHLALINSASNTQGPDKRTALCSFWCFAAHRAAVASENLRFLRIDGVAHQGSAAR